MPVHALDHHRLAVDQQFAVAQLHPPEADAAGGRLHHRALRRLQGDDQGVEVRRLRRPGRDAGDLRLQRHNAQRPAIGIVADRRGLHRRGQGLGQHRLAGGVEQLDLGLPAVLRLAREAQADGGLQGPGREVVLQGGQGEDVGDVGGRRGIEADLPVQAAHPPLVLILDEGGVRPLHHRQGDHRLLARGHIRGDVEVLRQAAVLAHAHWPAIDPGVEHALGPAHLQHDPPPVPVGGDRHAGAIEPGRVLVRHIGRRVRERHLDVGVVRPVMAVQGPVGGHGDRSPSAFVQAGLGEIGRDRFGPVDHPEPPVAVQGQVEGRGLASHRHCGLRIRKREQGRARRQPADGHRLRMDPGSRRARIQQVHVSSRRVWPRMNRGSPPCASAPLI